MDYKRSYKSPFFAILASVLSALVWGRGKTRKALKIVSRVTEPPTSLVLNLGSVGSRNNFCRLFRKKCLNAIIEL